jgi:hypothetical protein
VSSPLLAYIDFEGHHRRLSGAKSLGRLETVMKFEGDDLAGVAHRASKARDSFTDGLGPQSR